MKNHFIFQFAAVLLLTAAISLTGCQPKGSEAGQATTTATPTQSTTSSVKTDKHNIAYINTDTLLSQYTYFVLASKALAEKEQKANVSLEKKGRNLQNQVMAVQKKVQAGELTSNQIAQEEQRFAKKQQNLGEEQQRIAQDIMKETQEVQDTLYSKLRRVLRQYADQNGYDYVLSYAEVGSPVLIAPEGADITADIISILNADSGE